MKKYFFLFLIVILVGILSSPNKISAKTEIFSDDFSNGLEKWMPVRDNGQYWNASNGQIYAYILNGFLVSELIPKEQYLNRQLDRFEYQVDAIPMMGEDRNFSFGFVDLDNWYEIHFFGGNQFEVVKYTNGVKTWSHYDSGSLINNVINKVTITFDLGKVTITVNGSVIFNQIDPSYSNEKGVVGIKAGTGASYPTKIFFDNVKVFSLEDTVPTPTPTTSPTPTRTPTPQPTVTPTPKPTAVPTPTPKVTAAPTPTPTRPPSPTPTITVTPTPTPTHSMPHFKQDNDAWGDHVYDSADTWSPNKDTIADWGCAISSMAMIMRYHGINTMPDGSTLDPDSLNDWLIGEKDGYIGEGLINWAAAMRLTKDINKDYKTTKLEYRKINNGKISSAVTEINKNRPVIANIPGHFLVADSVLAGNKDLGIKDPLYDYSKLSQHTDAPTSFRAFTPSQTDLSYLVMVANPETTVRVVNPQGVDITDQVVSTEYITAETTGGTTTSKPQQLIEIAKPVTGTYRLSITAPHLLENTLEIYSYDTTGEVSTTTIENVVGDQPVGLTITYEKDGSTQVSQTATWQSFRNLLNELDDTGSIRQHALVKVIDRFAALASISSVKQQLITQRLIETLLETFPRHFITPLAQQSLLAELQSIKIEPRPHR